jgi:hypothetical protein
LIKVKIGSDADDDKRSDVIVTVLVYFIPQVTSALKDALALPTGTAEKPDIERPVRLAGYRIASLVFLAAETVQRQQIPVAR